MGLWNGKLEYFGQRLSYIGRETSLPATSRRILPAAHTLKSGLSSTDKKVWYVPGEISHCFQILSWNLTYLCMGSILTNDKDIANHHGKIFRQKAAIRPQNIGLKATAAKRPHFAHGCCKPFHTCFDVKLIYYLCGLILLFFWWMTFYACLTGHWCSSILSHWKREDCIIYPSQLSFMECISCWFTRRHHNYQHFIQHQTGNFRYKYATKLIARDTDPQ